MKRPFALAGRLTGNEPGTAPPADEAADLTGASRAGTAPAERARRRADPWRTALFGALVLAVLAGVAWALLGSSLLVVRHVEVTGTHLVLPAQVRSAARVSTGQPLARVNTAAAAHRVERIPAVLSATVTRSWPNTIVIAVLERTPGVAVAAAGGYDLVDEYGVTVRWAARKPAGLPLLAALPGPLRGSAEVRSAVLVLRELPRAIRRRLVSVSAASPASITLHLTGDTTVVWGGPGQAVQKSAELAMLLRKHARYYDVSDPAAAVTTG